MALVFAAVGAQVSWTLRPFLVRLQTVNVPFVRNVDGSLYDALRQSLRSAASDSNPPPPPWPTRLLVDAAAPASAAP